MKKQKKPVSLSLRGGSYSLILTAVVLALVMVLNVLAGALPENMTKYDMSATKLYSVTGNTRAVISALEDDVTIYWIVQAGEEDDVIENLLGRYESLSEHIQVVKKNPDVYPAFAEQYTDEPVQNNSLVVEAGERSRFIGYQDIYIQEPDLYSYTYNTSFDGEGAITSAIDYVVSEDLPKISILEGHGETELPASFKEQMEKDNMELSALSLLTAATVPGGKGNPFRICGKRRKVVCGSRAGEGWSIGKFKQPSGGLWGYSGRRNCGGRRQGALCAPDAPCADPGAGGP